MAKSNTDQARRRRLKELGAESLFSSLLDSSSDSSYSASTINIDDLPDDHDVKSDLDYKEFMESLLDPQTGTLRDFRIDDRSLHAATNYYDFCLNVIGKDAHMPWSRQFFASAMMLGEICPHCSNKKYLHIEGIPKDMPAVDLSHPKRLVLLENGVCPICGRTKHQLLSEGSLNPYNQGTFVWGQRSGKSSTAASIAAYTLHRYMKYPMLADLSSYMQKSTQLTAIFCSLTFKKAVEVLWTPFKNTIDTSTWFQEYFALLEDYRVKTGNKLLLNSATKLVIGNKKLFCFPTGPTASRLRGNTSFMTFLDELGLFPLATNEAEDDVNRRCSPDEAYTSLMNSLVTVGSTIENLHKQGYNSAPPTFMLSVSSPTSTRDKVMRLLKQSQVDNTIYASQLPTWEVNPLISQESTVIVSAFRNDPAKAMRDFGAQPSDTTMSFFNGKKAAELFIGAPPTHTLIQRSDDHETWGELKRFNGISYPSIMSLDAGFTNNSFSVSVLYYDFAKNRTAVACALEVMPMQGRTINFNKMYTEVILPLAKDLNVCYVCADRWNSIDLLHRLKEDMGFAPNKKAYTRADFYTLKRSDFESVRSELLNKSVIFPFLQKANIDESLRLAVDDYRTAFLGKPLEHLVTQFATVVDAGPSICPMKAEGYTDDILRTVVLGLSRIHTEKVSNRLVEFRDYLKANEQVAMPMPIVSGRSTGFMLH